MKSLDSTFQGAGFDAQLSENIMQDMWEKWVLMAGPRLLKLLEPEIAGGAPSVRRSKAFLRRAKYLRRA